MFKQHVYWINLKYGVLGCKQSASVYQISFTLQLQITQLKQQ